MDRQLALRISAFTLRTLQVRVQFGVARLKLLTGSQGACQRRRHILCTLLVQRYEAVVYVPRMPSSRPARMASHGRRIATVPMHATTSCTRHAGWAGRSGINGASITAVALLRRSCGASNCWANASSHLTSTEKSPNCTCARPCSIALVGWVPRLQFQCYKTIYKLRQLGLRSISSTKPISYRPLSCTITYPESPSVSPRGDY